MPGALSLRHGGSHPDLIRPARSFRALQLLRQSERGRQLHAMTPRAWDHVIYHSRRIYNCLHSLSSGITPRFASLSVYILLHFSLVYQFSPR